MDEDYYRNASNDHRTGGGAPWPGTWGPPAPRPQPQPQPQQMAPYQAPYAPPQQYGYPPPGYPAPYYPPGYPAPYGYPPPGVGFGSNFNGRTIGRLIRAVTPLVVSMLPLPAAPTPVASTGDTATDLKGSLTNEANMIAFQQAFNESIKRDETVFALGEALGILLEKGLS